MARPLTARPAPPPSEFSPLEVVILMYLVLWGEDYRSGRLRGKDRKAALDVMVGRGIVAERVGRKFGESEYVLTPEGVIVARAMCQVNGLLEIVRGVAEEE